MRKRTQQKGPLYESSPLMWLLGLALAWLEGGVSSLLEAVFERLPKPEAWLRKLRSAAGGLTQEAASCWVRTRVVSGHGTGPNTRRPSAPAYRERPGIGF